MYKYCQFLLTLLKPFIYTGFQVRIKKKKKQSSPGNCTYYLVFCDCQYLHESCKNTSEWVIIKHILQYLIRKRSNRVFVSVSHI